MDNNRTYLEQGGIERRKIEEIRNDYTEKNIYSYENEDAKTHNDEQHPLGKGTGEGGHTYSLPDHSASPKIISYKNFNTFNGGGSYDKFGRNGVGGRNKLQMINIYGPENEYSKDKISIGQDIVGQYVVS